MWTSIRRLFRKRKKVDEFLIRQKDGTEIVGRLTRYGTLLLQVTDPSGKTVDVQVPAHVVVPMSNWFGNIRGAYSYVYEDQLRTSAPVVPISHGKARADGATPGPVR